MMVHDYEFSRYVYSICLYAYLQILGICFLWHNDLTVATNYFLLQPYLYNGVFLCETVFDSERAFSQMLFGVYTTVFA